MDDRPITTSRRCDLSKGGADKEHGGPTPFRFPYAPLYHWLDMKRKLRLTYLTFCFFLEAIPIQPPTIPMSLQLVSLAISFL